MPDILVNFKIPKEIYDKIASIARDKYGHGGIKKIYNDLSLKFLEKHDGKQSVKLNTFFDPNYIPKPEIDGDVESQIIPWLRTLSNDQLSKEIQIYYQAYVWAQALRDTPPCERQTISFNPTTLWKRYR